MIYFDKLTKNQNLKKKLLSFGGGGGGEGGGYKRRIQVIFLTN